MGIRFVPVYQLNGLVSVSLVADRDVASEGPWPPRTAPAQTLLRYPNHKVPSGVSFHRGAIAPSVPLQLLFWGDYWNNAGSQQHADIRSKVQELLSGPYFDSLSQYGVTPPVFASSRVVTQPSPPTDPFDGGDISGMVWDLIDDDVFPEPDEGGRNAYHIMMPPGTVAKAGGGAHTSRFHIEFEPFPDVDWAWVGWSNYDPDSDTMTASFSHELVELTTDPEPGGGWYNDALDHHDGELGDLCQPNGIWQTAFVGNVQVMAYWSEADQSCIIPTHPFRTRIDGRVHVDERRADGAGNQESPFGENPNLCGLFPVCCFKGPYGWTRTQQIETAKLRMSTMGYRTPSVSWTVNGHSVAGNGNIDIVASVTRDNPTGSTEGAETVTLAYQQANDELRLTNFSVGNFDVTVSVATDETTATGGLGAARTAVVVVPFRGSDFEWDPQLARDQKRCDDAGDALWKFGHKATEKHPGPLDPGPLREIDREYLRTLGAWVSEETWNGARTALLKAARLQEEKPAVADGLRKIFLSGLGLPAPISGRGDGGPRPNKQAVGTSARIDGA
jgi:hypothetical protein